MRGVTKTNLLNVLAVTLFISSAILVSITPHDIFAFLWVAGVCVWLYALYRHM